MLSYFFNEILGNNFETLWRSHSILEHRRTKWTKNEFLMVVLVKYIIFKKIKIWVQRPLKEQTLGAYFFSQGADSPSNQLLLNIEVTNFFQAKIAKLICNDCFILLECLYQVIVNQTRLLNERRFRSSPFRLNLLENKQ